MPIFLFLFFLINPSFAQSEKELLYQDFSKLDLDVFAAPLKFETLYNLRNISYGFTLSNVDKAQEDLRYELFLNYKFDGQKVYDPFANQEVTQGKHQSTMLFDVNKIWGNWSYFFLADFRRTRYGDIHPLQKRLGFGPLGVKYDFYESKRIPVFNLSYVPIFENEVAEIRVGNQVNESHVNHIRHSIRFRFYWNIMDNITFREQLFYRPLFDYKNSKHDFKDNLLENVIEIDYKINDRFKIRYVNTYTYDIRQRRLYGFKPDNMVSEFFIDYKLRFAFLERWKKEAKSSVKTYFKEKYQELKSDPPQ